ncbi:MAG: hypothetical protein ACOY5U_01430 [Pseudomonadota bacterium]
MHRLVIPLAMALLAPLPAAGLCVANDTDVTLYFTVAAPDGVEARIGAYLEPGQELCLADTRSGVVAAFERDSSLEGCSRLATGADRLKRFARFDRCTWASHQTDGSAAND